MKSFRDLESGALTMDLLIGSIRYAARQFRSSRAFTAAAVTPNSPLAAGKYAIVIAHQPSPADDSLGGLVWDFRVE